jgi:1,4-dihydroxy-2-naphthoyl-CoA hydrolase
MTEQTTEDQLAAFNARRGELAERMGIVLTELGPERVTGTMPVAGNRQPYGLLHGGASAALAETLGSMHAAISAGPDATAVGIELNCSHHSSARDGLVHGVSTPLRVGRTLATFEIVVSDEAGTRICTSRLTCAIRPARDNRSAAGGAGT